jgi:hypothetical protein
VLDVIVVNIIIFQLNKIQLLLVSSDFFSCIVNLFCRVLCQL